MTSARPVLSAEEIAARTHANLPYVRLPDRDAVFGLRAMRLRSRAPGHALGEYLKFLAGVAEVQQGLLQGFDARGAHRGPAHADPSRVEPAPWQADAAAAAAAIAAGRPPLDATQHVREPVWQHVLGRLLDGLRVRVGPAQHAAIDRLAAMPAAERELQADRLLGEIPVGLDLAAAPLVAAALQVYWTRLAAGLDAKAFHPGDASSRCPCCATRPVASVVRIGGQDAGYRYLQCALCSTEWHVVRVKCAVCGSTRGIEQLSIEGGSRAIAAECCGECGQYLKIFNMEHDPEVEAVADDVASITLDLLVAERGITPAGLNYFLLQGEGPD